MQLAEEIGVKNLEAYGDSKLIVNQVHGEYEVRHEDLVSYHNTTIIVAEKFENFYIDHVSRQQYAHADALAPLAALLALLAGTTKKLLVYSRDLYCCKFALEDSKTPRGDLQVKEVFETSINLELRDWRSLTSTSSYMAYCLTTPKRQLPSEGKLLDSFTMRSCKHCIADRMMESCSDAFYTKRHRRHSKKLMMVCAELTNPDPSSETGSENLAIIGRR